MKDERYDENRYQPKKVCPKCHHRFPATEDFFYEDADHLYGVTALCRRCIKKRNAMYYQRVTRIKKGRA